MLCPFTNILTSEYSMYYYIRMHDTCIVINIISNITIIWKSILLFALLLQHVSSEKVPKVWQKLDLNHIDIIEFTVKQVNSVNTLNCPQKSLA